MGLPIHPLPPKPPNPNGDGIRLTDLRNEFGGPDANILASTYLRDRGYVPNITPNGDISDSLTKSVSLSSFYDGLKWGASFTLQGWKGSGYNQYGPFSDAYMDYKVDLAVGYQGEKNNITHQVWSGVYGTYTEYYDCNVMVRSGRGWRYVWTHNGCSRQVGYYAYQISRADILGSGVSERLSGMNAGNLAIGNSGVKIFDNFGNCWTFKVIEIGYGTNSGAIKCLNTGDVLRYPGQVLTLPWNAGQATINP